MKSRKKAKKGNAFAVSNQWIRYRYKGIILESKKASFLFKSEDKRYSMNVCEGEAKENDSDRYDMIITPFSKYYVGVNKLKLDGTEGDWFIGGLHINNDNMKILGYAEFASHNVLMYFNSETDTPFLL